MKKLFFLLLCALSLAISCNKDDDDTTNDPDIPIELPPATQHGANTFGCLIDGKLWVANVSAITIIHELAASYDETDTGIFYNNNFRLETHIVNDSINDGFVFLARHFDKPTMLNGGDHDLYISYRTFNGQISFPYHLDTLQFHQLEITRLDTAENICAGIFEFYALSIDKSDTLHITEGRFDTKYAPE